MTTYTAKRETTTSWPMFAALGTAISLVLTAIGTFWDVNGNDEGTHDSITEYLIVVGVVVVAAALVFGLVARRPTPTKALVLGILSVLSIVVFWAGLPAVFGAASLACATGSERMTASAKVGVGLSTVALVGAVVLAIFG